jgi:hypothetical protein
MDKCELEIIAQEAAPVLEKPIATPNIVTSFGKTRFLSFALTPTDRTRVHHKDFPGPIHGCGLSGLLGLPSECAFLR